MDDMSFVRFLQSLFPQERGAFARSNRGPTPTYPRGNPGRRPEGMELLRGNEFTNYYATQPTDAQLQQSLQNYLKRKPISTTPIRPLTADEMTRGRM